VPVVAWATELRVADRVHNARVRDGRSSTFTGKEAASPEQRAERESLARCFQGRMEIVPGSGHWLQLDRPDVVIRAINEMIVQVRRR
jgi:pimeloyl-ACP methyl ester carboxylesterase